MLCLLVAARAADGPAARALGLVGRESLVFYASHFVALWAVYAWLTAAGLENVMLLYIVGVSSAVGVGVGLSHARHRSRLVDVLFEFPDLPAGRAGRGG